MQDLFIAILKVQETHSRERGKVQIGKIRYGYHVRFVFGDIHISLYVVE